MSELEKETSNSREIAKNFLMFVIENSSIHGFNHLADKRRHIIEYILWFIGILLGVFGIFWLSQSTWYHYQNNPTVVSIENNYQEWNTIFPSITVCPDIQIEPDLNVFNEVLVKDPKSYKLASSDIGELQTLITKISNWTYSNPSLSENNFIIDGKTPMTPSEYARLFITTKNSFTYTLNYNEIEELEDEDLQVHMTEHGVCFGYLSKVSNYFNPMEWKYIRYKDKGDPFSSNPFDGDNYFQLTFIDEAGTKVFVHSPEELPDITSKGEHLQQHALKTIGVAALSIYSSSEVYDLNIHQRQCQFLWESNLQISPVYTYNACRMQCRYNLGLKLCGCVPHVYKSFGKEEICNPDGLSCLSKNEDLLMKLRDTNGKRVECRCLPPCNDVNYVIDQERNIKCFNRRISRTVPWLQCTELC
ncbi:sodium channel protein Nach-like isoform X2 [Nilaparvata lugens]|uniref:sodium channel protein Nach-like isoform X2 n=1 Tax=Nilaparvata lugens TaxID=108931 RepID=UPI00193E814F|nr:sodium channel protein Nach-like isoform X2 [Nilaparvata lugens]